MLDPRANRRTGQYSAETSVWYHTLRLDIDTGTSSPKMNLRNSLFNEMSIILESSNAFAINWPSNLNISVRFLSILCQRYVNKPNMVRYLLSRTRGYVCDLLPAQRCRIQSRGVRDIGVTACWIGVVPHLDVLPRKLLRHQGVELQRWTKTRSNFVKVLHFQD